MQIFNVSRSHDSGEENSTHPYVHTDLTSILWESQQAVKEFTAARPSLAEGKEKCATSEYHSAACSSSLSITSREASKLVCEEEEAVSNLYSKIVKIQAPMVRCSRPAFRKLCRLWGTDVSYTAMIMAESFSHSAAARDADFSLYQHENRLVVQLASSSGPDAAIAAVQLQPYCDAIDLNCGCPQKWAIREGIGAAMLKNPEQVADVVHCIRNALSSSSSASSSLSGLPIPCVVKMRIDDDLRKSVDFARHCVAAGVSWLTIHGRTPQCSSHAPVRHESIQLLREIVEAERIPVVANGGVDSMLSGFQASLACGAGGVMAANGLLDNPAAFALRQRGEGGCCYYSSSSTSSSPEVFTFLPDPYNPIPFSSLSTDALPSSGISTSSHSSFLSPPPPPREVLSDFLRLIVDMDMTSTASVQHFLRMARCYLSPSERSYISTLRSNMALLMAAEECGLYTTNGRYTPTFAPALPCSGTPSVNAQLEE